MLQNDQIIKGQIDCGPTMLGMAQNEYLERVLCPYVSTLQLARCPGGLPRIIPIRTGKKCVGTSKITFFQNFKVVACVVQCPLGDSASEKDISQTKKT